MIIYFCCFIGEGERLCLFFGKISAQKMVFEYMHRVDDRFGKLKLLSTVMPQADNMDICSHPLVDLSNYSLLINIG